MIIRSRRLASVVALALVAALGGTLAAFHYHRIGLTLSHYDARGHLVVARRIFDSITPGWQQIGAVWLPLPHLLNAIPVQIDVFYRTGASATAISILSFAIAVSSIAWIVATITDSNWAGAGGAAVFALNPNVLYLQATPMTEPLLMALTLLSIALLMRWCRSTLDPPALESPLAQPPVKLRRSAEASAKAESEHDTSDKNAAAGAMSPDRRTIISARGVGVMFALACLTRYEAWPVTGAALTAAVWARWRLGDTLGRALSSVSRIAAYPAVAVLAFLAFSRIVGGVWLADDFFVPENPAQGRPFESLALIVWGTRALSSYGLVVLAGAGALALAGIGATARQRASAVIPLALLATACVPWLAFLDGHPYRIRYMVPLIAFEAVGAGVAAGIWKRAQAPAIAGLLLLVAVGLHPLAAAAPMVVEAQWDRPNITARDEVTRCLAPQYRGETIMASMGSLGHYMQDLSRSGFAIRDFLHEGNGDIWLNALNDPRPFVGWVLVEEKAEGGDMLAKRMRENPTFLDGFSRVCEAAGLVLYRRTSSSAGEDARHY